MTFLEIHQQSLTREKPSPNQGEYQNHPFTSDRNNTIAHLNPENVSFEHQDMLPFPSGLSYSALTCQAPQGNTLQILQIKPQ